MIALRRPRQSRFEKKKRNIDKDEGWWHFQVIHRILRQIRPEKIKNDKLTISSVAVNVMKSMIIDVVSRILFDANTLLERTKRKTLKSRDIHFATRLTFSGTLDMHKKMFAAITESIKQFDSVNRKIGIYNSTHHIPLGELKKNIKSQGLFSRIDKYALVSIATIIETLISELLTKAVNYTRVNKRTRIIPREIKLAIHNDNDLYVMFGKVIIKSGGVVGFVNLEDDIPKSTQQVKDEIDSNQVVYSFESLSINQNENNYDDDYNF